jgi:hypothetical protein
MLYLEKVLFLIVAKHTPEMCPGGLVNPAAFRMVAY